MCIIYSYASVVQVNPKHGHVSATFWLHIEIHQKLELGNFIGVDVDNKQ